MSTPIYEIDEPVYVPAQHYHTGNNNQQQHPQQQYSHSHLHNGASRPLSQDGTFVGDNSNFASTTEVRGGAAAAGGNGSEPHMHLHQPGFTEAQLREMNSRMDDDLQMLKAERIVSSQSNDPHHTPSKRERRAGFANLTTIESEKEKDLAASMCGSHGDDDDFGATEKVAKRGLFTPAPEPSNKAAKIFKKVHESSFLVRYFLYIIPVSALICIPILLGAFVFKKAHVGQVELMWFCIWLMIVWLSLWAARIISKGLVYPVGMLASLFTNSSKKWRDMAKMLEVPCTLFFWALAVFISFMPTMTDHHMNKDDAPRKWEETANKVWTGCLVMMSMNFIEKIVIQLIAISFHERTYEDRIETNKFQLRALVKLYEHTNALRIEDEIYARSTQDSGTRTPLAYLRNAKDGLQSAVNKAGDILGKAAADFTNKNVQSSTSPHQVVLQILSDPDMTRSFGRRIFRCFSKPGETEFPAHELATIFDGDDGEAVLGFFDKDLSGDISEEEIQIALSEIGRERKSIIASLKDLDSVVSKLDSVLTFIVLILTVLVFIAILSGSTTTILASTGSTLLALSWLFSQTAQEFLASIVFVFVKHPFDVGDRVDIMVNNEVVSYFVKEIALMYTEFKRMEGHVVQAPNSLLNTLFILNMRRSPALAEAIPITIKFGTTIHQIEELRKRMLEFVTTEKRDYQPKIFTEVKDIRYLHEVKLNVVFFYKSNWQNELVRLQRRNKFMCTLMSNVADIGIESPHRRWPGQTQETPIYLQGMMPGAGAGGLFTAGAGGGGSSQDEMRDQILTERTQGPAGPGSGASLAVPVTGDHAPSPLSLAPPAHPGAGGSPSSPLSPSGTSAFWRSQQGGAGGSNNNNLHRSESLLAQSKKLDLSLGTNDSTLNYGDAFVGEKKQIPGIEITRSRARGDSTSHNSLEHVASRTSQSTTDSRNVQGSIRRRDRFFSRGSQGKEGESSASAASNLDDLEAGTRVPHSTPNDPAHTPGAARRTTTGQLRNMRSHEDDHVRPI